jgi:hypothetical protein
MGKTGGDMATGSENPDDRYAHREASLFDAGIVGVTLDHRVESCSFRFDDFLDQRRYSQQMMQAVYGEFFREFLVDGAAAEIFRRG